MHAITRLPSTTLPRCTLSFIDRQPLDVDRARAQHTAYRAALEAAGVEVVVLPALDAYPDAVFVEDTALVLDELAILAPMGAASRAGESTAIAATLSSYRPLAWLCPPATLDGGDVLRLGRTLYVGLSRRTNDAAVEQLATVVTPLGYRVVPTVVASNLHLKTGCSYAGRTPEGDDIIVFNPQWTDPSTFTGVRLVEIDPDEPWAANVLCVPSSGTRTTLVMAGNPRTHERLTRAGLHTVPVDISELQKAEAGLTCLSLFV